MPGSSLKLAVCAVAVLQVGCSRGGPSDFAASPDSTGEPTAVAMDPARRSSECIPYEPDTVKLTGYLENRIEAGPPNYDAKEGTTGSLLIPVIRLQEPIAVCATAGDEINVAEDSIAEIQLTGGSWDREAAWARPAVLVEATGVLFHAHTGHHYRLIIMKVDTLRPYQSDR